jgi:hypothetical protein
MDHLQDYKLIVEIFKGYLDTALTVHSFYYALTGAITAYYLAHRRERKFMKCSLILPLVLDSHWLALPGLVDLRP